MNSFMAGALSGIAGGAGAYSSIQKDQREFRIKEQEAAANAERQENFARFNYNLKKEVTPSGKANPDTGIEYTMQEYSALSGPEKESVVPSWKAREDYSVKKTNSLKEKKRKEAEELLKEKRKYEESKVEEQRKYKEEQTRKQNKLRDKKDKEKEAERDKKDFTKELRKTLRDEDASTPAEKALFTLNIYSDYSENPNLSDLKVIQQAKLLDKKAKLYNIVADKQGEDAAIKLLKENGVSDKELEDIKEYLNLTGQIDSSWIENTWSNIKSVF